MNRGRPKNHIKVSCIKYIDMHGVSHCYYMDDLKSNKRKEKDIMIKISIPNSQNKKQEKKEHSNNDVEVNKPMSTKFQNALSFYNGNIIELYFDIYEYMKKKLPQLLKDFQNQQGIKENENKSEENNLYSQIGQQSYQSIDDFEENSNPSNALHLLNLELNKSPPELQEYDNFNTISGFQSLYL